MKNTKRSITYKVIVSYLIAAILTSVAFWVIITQITNYFEMTELQDDDSKNLFLISKATTDLYEAESLGRNLTRTGDTSKMNLYRSRIKNIKETITKIADRSKDSAQLRKVDTIKSLLEKKNSNLNELIALYSQNDKSYYKEVFSELKRTDDTFISWDYENRFANLLPHQRDALVKWLNYAKKDNAGNLSNKTVDSLAKSLKKVLSNLDRKDRNVKRKITKKENALLENDQIISKQLRDFLASIEQNEISASYQRVEASQQILNRTTKIIALVAGLIIVLVVIFLVLITRDISKSNKYRVELEEAKVFAESLLRSKESFMNMITHDLRSPLNTVLGYSELLQDTSLDKKQSYYVNSLKKSSDYTIHLVNDLLDLSKLDAGKMVVENLPFRPDKLIHEVMTVAIPLVDKKELSITLQVADELHKQYLGDPFRIKQILTNLVTNAYKFTENGGITVNATLQPYAPNNIKNKFGALCIEVIDTGIGIPEEQQKLIFEEFSQASGAIEKQYGGSGLGLTITQKIITLLDGSIQLRSELGKGSTFRIEIPIDAVTLEYTEEKPKQTVRSFKNKRILIVDDDPAQLALTTEVVSGTDISFDTQSDATQVLEMMTNHRYDAIFTDIQMPKLSGFELLRQIRQHYSFAPTPVVALSGRTDFDKEYYRQVGFVASLQKPYAPNDLLMVLSEVLEIPMHTTLKPAPHTYIKVSRNEYDLDDLLEFAQGDLSSLHMIINTFCDSSIDNANELSECLDQKNYEQIPRIAHRMLPMFRQIKATGIVEILETLESASSNRLYKKTIHTMTQDVVTQIRQLILNIRRDQEVQTSSV